MASSLLIKGNGVKKNYQLARKYLIQSLNLGNEKAEKFLQMLNDIDGGSGSFEDYDMGAVIGSDGKPSFIDVDSGIIIGSDGSISAHNYKYGTIYNCKTGNILVYDNRLDATLNLSEGNIKLNLDGFTI